VLLLPINEQAVIVEYVLRALLSADAIQFLVGATSGVMDRS
ncbi:unnamed protein product, partial [Acidithrix sp. C25]